MEQKPDVVLTYIQLAAESDAAVAWFNCISRI